MPEPNATVSPFDSAGVRLPTQGKGYSGTDSATDVAIAAAFGSPVPQNNTVPGPQTFVFVDIPFAAGGELVEVEYNVGVRADNANVTPATTFTTLVGLADSALVPNTFFLQSSIDSSPNATIALTDFVNCRAKTVFEVPDGLTYPLTVFLVYFSDGDALIGENQSVGVNPAPCNFSVQRVPRERVLLMPPQNLI